MSPHRALWQRLGGSLAGGQQVGRRGFLSSRESSGPQTDGVGRHTLFHKLLISSETVLHFSSIHFISLKSKLKPRNKCTEGHSCDLHHGSAGQRCDERTQQPASEVTERSTWSWLKDENPGSPFLGGSRIEVDGTQAREPRPGARMDITGPGDPVT